MRSFLNVLLYVTVYSLDKCYVIIFLHFISGEGRGGGTVTAETPGLLRGLMPLSNSDVCGADATRWKWRRTTMTMRGLRTSARRWTWVSRTLPTSAARRRSLELGRTSSSRDSWTRQCTQSINFISFYHVVLVDGLPTFQVNLAKAAFFSSGWACWFNASTQFFFMTALLMRWQVIPVNFVVFVIDLIFEIPRYHMLPRVKK